MRFRRKAQIFIPPASCRYVVISDIDDTVMQTGVANKLRMLWRLFVEDAQSRVAFPGVGALYRALHAGASGDEQNPMLYVSRAPWGIYEVLEEFFDPAWHPGRPDPVPARMGRLLDKSAAAQGRGPQARADPQHAGALQ